MLAGWICLGQAENENAVTGDLVPTFTKNVKVGQPPNAPYCAAGGPPSLYAYDKLCFVTKQDPTNHYAMVASTATSYDTQANLVQKREWVGQGGVPFGVWLTTNYQYSNGILSQVQDPNGTWTYLQYDGSCGSMLPTSTSNSFNSLTTSASYDTGCYGAVQKSATGPNGVPVQATYNDPLWRADTVTAQNGLVTNLSWPTQNTQETLSLLNTNSGSDVWTTTDGLGRTIAVQRRQSPSSDSYDTVTTSYDNLGRVSAVTEPFTAARCNAATGCWGTGAKTTYTYFADGKPNVITDANLGTVTYSYPASASSGVDVVTTLGPAPQGESVKSKQLEFDGLGRLKSVCEITSQTNGACGQVNGGTGFPTTYVFDAIGRITSVNQGIQQRQFAYDGVGRIVAETNPETGTTSYTFDSSSTPNCSSSSAGDLVAMKDANQVVTCFGYDGLHRPVSKTYGTDTVTDTVGFSYDAGTYGGGRLTEAWTCAAGTVPCPVSSARTAESFGYDAGGNLITYSQFSPGHPGWWTATETFDVFDNLLSMTGDGAGFYKATAWDGLGHPTTVTNDAGSIVLQSSATYGFFGPTCVAYGNGDLVATSYDNVGHIRSKTISVGGTGGSCTSAGTTYQTDIVTWNANGTVNSVERKGNLSGTLADVTISYTYDDLGRILTASSNDTPQGLNQTFTYDRYGNISAVSGHPNMYTAGVDPSTNRLIQNQGCPNVGPCYDANGRTTIDETNEVYVWDANGKLIQSGYHGLNNYIRDAFGRATDSPGSNTKIWIPGFSSPMQTSSYGHVTLDLPGGSSVHWSAGCSCGTPFTNFSHTDYLGNTTASNNYLSSGGHYTGGSSVWRYRSYAPFGQEFNAGNGYGGWDGGADGFDGTDNVLDYTGLWDTPARELDSVAGRWISPDPAGRSAASPGSPQSWNRYTYASNMPTVMSDPSGLCDYMQGDGTTGGGGSTPGPCPDLENAGSENKIDLSYNASDIFDPNANLCSICAEAMNDSVDMNGPESTPLTDALAAQTTPDTLGSDTVGGNPQAASEVAAGGGLATSIMGNMVVSGVTGYATGKLITGGFTLVTAMARSLGQAGEDAVGLTGSIDPGLVRFSQNSIRGTFSDGGSVADLASGLKNGTINPSDVPPIRLVNQDGQLFTLDNRRLAAFQQAGIRIPYRMATPSETALEAWKFTTQNGGVSIRIR